MLKKQVHLYYNGQFRIGYNKAARIIDQLEADGVIGPQIGSKPREVYIRGYQEEDI